LNYNKALMNANILNPTIRYRGCLVHVGVGWYTVLGQVAPNWEDVDRIINEGLESLKKSIKDVESSKTSREL